MINLKLLINSHKDSSVVGFFCLILWVSKVLFTQLGRKLYRTHFERVGNP